MSENSDAQGLPWLLKASLLKTCCSISRYGREMPKPSVRKVFVLEEKTIIKINTLGGLRCCFTVVLECLLLVFILNFQHSTYSTIHDDFYF